MTSTPDTINFLCISRIAAEVPVTFQKSGTAALFAERQYLGLPTVYPDATKHKSIRDVIVRNLKALGFEPNQYTEKYCRLGLHAGAEPYDYEDSGDVAIHTHYVLNVDDANLNFGPAIKALNKAQPRLGESLWYLLIESQLLSSLPGVMQPQEINSMFQDWRTESSTTDEEAREFMESNGYEEDLILASLPSTLTKQLGGKSILKPRPPQRPKNFLADLKNAGIKDAKELSDLLTKRITKVVKAIKAARAIAPPFNQPYELFPIRVWANNGPPPSSLVDFMDELMQHRAENGEPIDHLFLQRVGINPKSKVTTHNALDGLAFLAQLLQGYTCLDELAERLKNIPNQVKEHNEHQLARGNRNGAGQRTASLQKQKRCRKPALHQPA